MTIWKFPIPGWRELAAVCIPMPMGAKILCVQRQGNTPTLWAEVETRAPTEARYFLLVGTGQNLDLSRGPRYVGTVLLDYDGGTVLHVYEAPAWISNAS